MSRPLLSPSLLALGLAAALPVFAQSHAGHDIAAMAQPAKTAKAPVEQVDHSKMDHS
ncbi:MAG: copper resistance protein B, partial [Stenotrophomonas sp.]|nr:copper resistance protein B [Stenotrophomonas sp.]